MKKFAMLVALLGMNAVMSGCNTPADTRANAEKKMIDANAKEQKAEADAQAKMENAQQDAAKTDADAERSKAEAAQDVQKANADQTRQTK